MGNFIRAVLLAGSAATLVGCGSLPWAKERSKITELPEGKPVLVTYTESARGAYYVAMNGAAGASGMRVIYCAEPPPDVSVNALRDLTAELKADVKDEVDASAALSDKLEATAVELKGRSETVLLTRELLYRLCELSVNLAGADADKFEAISGMYGNVVKLTGDLAEADRLRAEARAVEAFTAAGQQEKIAELKINAILDHVAKPNGTIDAERLETLLQVSPRAEGVAEVMKQQTTRSALQSFLDDDVADDVIDQMYKALPSI